jgi:hypothetical protein
MASDRQAPRLDQFFFEKPHILRQLIKTYFIGSALQQHSSAARIMQNRIGFRKFHTLFHSSYFSPSRT